MTELMRRRRALMGKKAEADTTIYGSRLTWEIGNINSSTGEIDPSETTYISSDYVAIDGGKVLTYTGPSEDGNNVAFYVYIGEYDENKTFIKRVGLYSFYDHYDGWQLGTNCKYIRIQFGHSSASAVNMNVSDGALFTCLVQDRSEVKNGFVDGSYTGTGCSFSISNNVFSISQFNASVSTGFNPIAKLPVPIETGDSVRVLIKKTAGSVSGSTFINGWLSGQKIITNKSWGSGTTALDNTETSPGNGNTRALSIRNAGSTKTYSGYKCTITVYVNGVQVLPEV